MLAFGFPVKSTTQTAIQAPTNEEKGAIMAQDFGDNIIELLLHTGERVIEGQMEDEYSPCA